MSKGHRGLIASGKTKQLSQMANVRNVGVLQQFNKITKGDGAVQHEIPGKGTLTNSVNCKIFELLEKKGVPTHFIEKISADECSVFIADMIPLEIVGRLVEAGSYLDRNPNASLGVRLETPVIECYFKDDARHDPFVLFDDIKNPKRMYLYDAHKPITDENRIDTVLLSNEEREMYKRVGEAMDWTFQILLILQDQWKRHADTDLIDLKVEFGILPNLKLVLADDINNDSWRIWPHGDRLQEKSKQVYRDAKVITLRVLAKVRSNYRWVTKQVEKFD